MPSQQDESEHRDTRQPGGGTRTSWHYWRNEEPPVNPGTPEDMLICIYILFIDCCGTHRERRRQASGERRKQESAVDQLLQGGRKRHAGKCCSSGAQRARPRQDAADLRLCQRMLWGEAKSCGAAGADSKSATAPPGCCRRRTVDIGFGSERTFHHETNRKDNRPTMVDRRSARPTSPGKCR